MRTTRQERVALGTVALLLTLGAGARWTAPAPPPAEWSAAADTAPVERVEAEVGRAERRATPLAPGERIDPNRAGPDELDRLPRVGPALARRIVARRESHGPFRTLADLDSVSGVGPALLEALAPHLTLSAAPAAGRGAGPSAAPLDVNAASAAELERLPGIGPALAARIVETRARRGRFRSVEELAEVPGIGEKSVRRLAPLVRASP